MPSTMTADPLADGVPSGSAPSVDLVLGFLSGNPAAPNRRRRSSAVSALVLSFSLLLCAYLRVSASPRQNHTLGLPTPFHHGLVRGIEICTQQHIITRSET